MSNIKINIYSTDSVTIKDSKIPGVSMLTTAGNRNSISGSHDKTLNTKCLHRLYLFIHIYHDNYLLHIKYQFRHPRHI